MNGCVFLVFVSSLLFTLLEIQVQGNWSSWTDCSVTCGSGTQGRWRPCDGRPLRRIVPEGGCNELYGEDTKICKRGPCREEVPYGQQCTSQDKCVGGNTECKVGTCQCISGFYRNGNDCVTKVGLGYSCLNGNACKDANTLCKNGKCRCSSQYYDDNGLSSYGGNCKIKVELGSSGCSTGVSDSCKSPNAGCQSNGYCTCNSGYYDKNGGAGGGTCTKKIELGSRGCSTIVSDSCKSPNARCQSNGYCTCNSGYYDNNGGTGGGTCTKKIELGSRGCSTSVSDSCKSPNARCQSNGYCTCNSGYYDNNGGTGGGPCTKERSLDETCSANSHCSPVNSECSGQICSCKSDFFRSANTCTKRKLGQSCDATNQCSAANAVCSSKICQCPSTYYDTTGSAIGGACSLKVSLGGLCQKPTSSLPNTATCSDTYARCTGSGSTYTCQCIGTYFDNMDSTDRKCEQKVGLGLNCPRDNACGTTNAGCVGGKCVCNYQYFDSNGLSNNGGNCVIRISLGTSCNGNPPTNIYQCSDSSATCFRSSGSYRCTCNRGYHQEGSQCVANKPLGQTCSVSTDCSDPAAGCLNGKCTCDSNYYDDNGFTVGGTCVLQQYSDESNYSTATIIIGVVLGITNLLLLVYAGYTTFLIRRYRANKDGPNMSKSNINDRKKQTYANTSFTESVGGRTDVESSRNIALSNEPDAEYSRLDDHTRDDRTTYDIIQCSR